MTKDLSACAGEQVGVTLRALEDYTDTLIVSMDGDCIDNQDITIDNYDLTRELLQNSATTGKSLKSLYTAIYLNQIAYSNQPDWGR